jgi:nucleoside-diphosphate-sugar epimerase
MTRTVLMTGAAGKCGRALLPHLRARYSLSLTDAVPFEPGAGLTSHPAELGDLDRLAALCRGMDTVVHLAATSDLASGWEPLLRNNIIGCHNLLRAAAEAGCRRVVLASSIHAVDGYPRGAPIGINVPALPRTLYGATKAWAEALASVVSQRDGVSTICLRLGWVMAGDDSMIHLDNDRLGIILTHDDMARLFLAAIEAPESLRYGVFYGLSNNQHNQYDLAESRRVLHYEPRDDAFAIARSREPRGVRGWIRAARRGARAALRRG